MKKKIQEINLWLDTEKIFENKKEIKIHKSGLFYQKQ